MQAGNQRIIQLFSAARNVFYASRKRIKNRKIKPACTAGRLWLFQAPIGGPDVSVLVLGVIHRADDEPVGDGGEGMVVIAGGRLLEELVPQVEPSGMEKGPPADAEVLFLSCGREKPFYA